MSEITIKFEPSVPKGAHAELRALIAPYLPLLAGEIRVLRVALKKGADVDGEGEASTMTLRRYHFAVIALDPEFFALDEAEKVLVTAHEITHILHDLFSREVFHLVHGFVPDEMKGYIFGRLDDAEERVVDKIAMTLVKMREGR